MSTTPKKTAVRRVIRRPYATIPLDVLLDAGITLADRCVLAYILALAPRPGWVLYVAEIKRTMRLSAGGWQACRRRLEAAGYYRQVKRRTGGGAWEWDIAVTDTPWDFGDGEEPTIPHAMIDGGVIDHGADDRHIPTHIASSKQQQQGSARAGAAAASHRQQQIIAGVTTWIGDDRDHVATLVQAHGVEAVAQAAEALRRSGRNPLPTVVDRELRRQSAAAARRSASAPPAAPREDPDTAAQRAAAHMASLRGGAA